MTKRERESADYERWEIEWEYKIRPLIQEVGHRKIGYIICTNLQQLSTWCIQYMSTKESNDKSHWSDDVLDGIRSELADRIILGLDDDLPNIKI